MNPLRWLGLVWLAATLAGAADTLYLLDGDRLSGRVAIETTRAFQLETAYGRLTIPRAKVEKRVRADGREEIIHAREAVPEPSPTPAPEPLGRLMLVMTGKTFWQAWDPREAPTDPSLRLEVRLDEDVVATFTDSQLDEEIPKAVVNAFSFAPAEVRVAPGPGVKTSPPETRPGRIVLRLDVPPGTGTRRLRLAYQMNDGSALQPAWHDLAESAVHLEIRLLSYVIVKQDRGAMEFSGFPRRKMKGTETFRIELHPE